MHTRLYRAAQVRELDRRAIQDQGIPGYTLMSKAGAATFAALQQHWPDTQQVIVVCGGGNNGGDGYVVARLAVQAGLKARILYLKEPEGLKGDALTAFQDARSADVPIQPFQVTYLEEADVIVDALLGTGLEREVRGLWQEAIDAINQHPDKVLAVDIPSGLHADTGAILGVAIQAALTVSFIGLKQGLFSGQGPSCCGQVLFDDLEVPSQIYQNMEPASYAYQGEDLSRLLPKRSRSAHKGDHGHVLVVGGDLGMAGAARMAAEAAARCGAGLVSVATHSEHAALQAAVCPELMFHGVNKADDLEPLLERATVVAIGPGLGRSGWGQALLNRVLAWHGPLVMDADALNLLAAHPSARDHWILTPHPGEAGRLLGLSSQQIEADRFNAVKTLADRFNGVCVLKGAGSLIARKGDKLWLCCSGNPGMGSGGMGDVLTGVIAGLLAQGLTLDEAARAGAYLHGRAGDLAAETGERGLLATDLLPFLRRLVNPTHV